MADESVPAAAAAAETLADLSSSSSSSDPSRLSRAGSFSRLNAAAPEFVPRAVGPPPQARSDPRLAIPPPALVRVLSPPPPPPPNPTFHPQIHYQTQQFGDATEPPRRRPDEEHAAALSSKNLRSEEAAHQKIVNQIEYYFSDVNLATTDQLIRFINKDPEGYVPISVVASFKKIKSFTNDHSQLAAVLRKSKKLEVSEDGKKVRRKYQLTESDMEDLQSRIVVAENLPDDHCYQNLMKIFSGAGRVKAIRTCQPQTPNGLVSSTSRSIKTDNAHFSNKLHAFVEYDTVELAEKAVAELNGEGTWRSGLRVWLLGRHVPKPNQARGRKGHEGNGSCKEGDASTLEQHPIELQSEDLTRQSEFQLHEHIGEEYPNSREGGQFKGRNRGRGRGRGRAQSHHYNSNHRGTAGVPSSNAGLANVEQPAVVKQHPPGPRMPDGTRGFSMGRGKPVAVTIV